MVAPVAGLCESARGGVKLVDRGTNVVSSRWPREKGDVKGAGGGALPRGDSMAAVLMCALWALADEAVGESGFVMANSNEPWVV